MLRTVIFFLFISLTCLKSHAQRPVAGFTVGGTNPQCAPAIFSLQDNSTGATSIFYRLGDGRNTPPISPGQLSGALYNNPGTYTITQIATNAFGSDSTQRTVTVSPSPLPEFSVDNAAQCFPLRATFTDLSDPLGTPITSWFWDFGDGNTSTQRNPQHVYTINNVFRVTLIVTNAVGCTGTLNKDNFITVTPGVRAGFFNSFASSCKPPSVIDFFNTSTGPGAITHTWRFGDGTPSVVGNNPSHVYNAAGTYNVTLIASSSDGCTDSVTNQVEIPDVNISSSINAPDTGCVNQPILFSNVSSPAADSSGWNFGDGTENTGPSVTKRYAAPGSYRVKLTNLFGGCLDSVVRRIVILDTPAVSFNSADTVNCRAPHTVRFTANAPGAVAYQWDFGDGSPVSTQANPQKDYTSTGSYTVTLGITNRLGCTSRRTQRDFIKILPPSISFRNLPDSGCVPLTISPRANIVAVDGVASYFWTFHDETSSSPTPTKTYTAQGTYSVGLAITTRGGCLATIGLSDAVKVGTRPTADFTAAPLNLCAGEPVNFTNLSGGNPTGFRWDFGDTANRAGGSTQANPIYQYTDTGRFTVKLFVFNNGCVDSAVKPAYISAFGAVARFGFNVNCSNKRQVSFLDSSINASSIVWNFGDGSPVTSTRNPVHTYAALGDYDVTLTATQGSCTYVLTKKVRLFNETAAFTVSPTTLCRGAITTFRASAIDSNIRKYEWDWGNGVLDTGRNIFTYVYDTPRVYIARMAITDINGCADTASRSIGVGGPRARFFAANPTGCVGLTVNFADSSLSDGVNAIVSRVWDFGDGAIQTINSPPVSHQYTTTGFFNVKLRVTDAVGCTDSLVRNSFVVASSPRAAFSSPDTLSCPGRNVQFLTQSTGAFNAGAHFWNFGDGRTSNFNNPQNAYARAGRYDVRLRVTDRFGCSDSIVRTQYITIDTPFAAFDVSDDQATCPPLIATFYNRSRYQASQRWDFGDGDISVLPDSPVHIYNVPGTYVSQLVITSPGGCTDTAFRTITIFGPTGSIAASSPTAGCVPLTVNLSVRTTNTDSVTWIFGDGTVEFGRDTVKTHTYTRAGDAILEVFLKDSTGCRVPIRFASPIRVIGITPGFDSDKKLLCDNGSISFADTTRTNGVIQNWDWDFGDGTRGSGPTPSHFYNSTGFYDVKLRITTEFGCTDSVTVPRYIKSVASPVAGIASSDTACQNRFITYRGNILQPDTSAVRWAWNFANGNTSTVQNPPAQQYLVPGSLTVQLLVTNSSGCVDTVTRDIRIHPLPQLDAGADSTICLGQSVSLNATGASTYQWLLPNNSLSCTNCGDPVASPASSITYRVRGTSVDGCQVDDSVRVSVVQPSSVQAPPNDSLCLGQGMQLFASGTQVYRWSPATGLNNPNTASPIARPTTTTTYVVTGSDARGCFVTRDSVTISVFPLPIFDLGPDVTIPVGSSVRFTPRISGNIVSVRWSPTTGLSCTDCQDPVASPRQKTQYTVTAVNDGGCTITDQITVFVTCSGDNLFIPNTFSPNGDGMNDQFYPRGRGILEIKSIKVFSRWGQQVYWRNNIRANDASQGWDGTFKGVALSPDVYVYIIDVVCENNSVVTLKGDVMLVR